MKDFLRPLCAVALALTGCATNLEHTIIETATTRNGVVGELTPAAKAMVAECDRMAQEMQPGQVRYDRPSPNPTLGSTNRSTGGFIFVNINGQSRPLEGGAIDRVKVATANATVIISASMPINPNHSNLALDAQSEMWCQKNQNK